jgi:hypothetical protein
VTLTACVTSTPMPTALGYLPVAHVTGCGTPANTGPLRSTNIVLGQELSDRLLELLTIENVDSPQCWYERSDGVVELESGPFCEPTLLAYFRRVNGEWKLETQNTQPLVLCHERAATEPGR